MMRASLAGAFIVALAWSGQAPTQAPVFRTKAENVEVHAVVTDRTGAIVRGLTQQDFQVTEDGKAQDVVLFSFIDMPLPKAALPDGRTPIAGPASDVATNAQPPDRRLYAIVLDASTVDATRSTVVKRLARQFIEDNLGSNDLAAVVQLGRTTINQPFTSNKALLIAALDKFIGHKLPPPSVNIARDAMLRPQRDVPEDFESGARANDARRLLEALKQVCESLGTSRGYRRSLVLFSEGLDVDTTDLIGEDKRPGAGGQGRVHEPAKVAGFVLQAQQDLYVAARRAGVAVHAIDPRGNTMGEDVQMQFASGASTTGVMTEVQRGQGVLRTLAQQTGGLAVVNTGSFKAGFESIVQANSSYYVLAYAPTNPARDGTYRSISVVVKRPDVTVNARKGYVAPIDTPPASAPPAPAPNTASIRMREVLVSALPVSGLPVKLMGGPVRPAGDKMLVALVLEIDTTAVPFREEGDVLKNDIEMAFLAMDAAGKMVAGNRTMGNLGLSRAQRSALTSVRYIVEFPASPGRFQVRVGAYETAGETAGSALIDVEVPDPSKAPLSIGTILLTSTAAASVPTTGSFPQIKALLPAPPSAARQFAPSDTLAVFVNVFAAASGRSESVEVVTVAHGADGREAFRHAVTKSGEDLAPGQGGYGHRVSVPLAGLAPGEYSLTLTAKSSSGRSASRTVRYSVR